MLFFQSEFKELRKVKVELDTAQRDELVECANQMSKYQDLELETFNSLLMQLMKKELSLKEMTEKMTDDEVADFCLKLRIFKRSKEITDKIKTFQLEYNTLKANFLNNLAKDRVLDETQKKVWATRLKKDGVSWRENLTETYLIYDSAKELRGRSYLWGYTQKNIGVNRSDSANIQSKILLDNDEDEDPEMVKIADGLEASEIEGRDTQVDPYFEETCRRSTTLTPGIF